MSERRRRPKAWQSMTASVLATFALIKNPFNAFSVYLSPNRHFFPHFLLSRNVLGLGMKL